MTGVSFQQIELTAKRMGLLKDLLPKARRIAVLSHSIVKDQLAAARTAARTLGLELQPIEVNNQPNSYTDIFQQFMKTKPDAVFVLMAGVFFTARAELASLSLKYKRPGMYGLTEFPEAGGLISYGANISDLFRVAAGYVDRILKGNKAAEMPVEQPTKFELVVNRKTATTMGITIPQSILVRADRMIE